MQRGSTLHVHFKNTQAIEGTHVGKAATYPRMSLYRSNECHSSSQWWSCAQDTGRWPRKSAEFLLHVLKAAESSAELKGADVGSLVAEHIQLSKAPQVRPRTQSAWAD